MGASKRRRRNPSTSSSRSQSSQAFGNKLPSPSTNTAGGSRDTADIVPKDISSLIPPLSSPPSLSSAQMRSSIAHSPPPNYIDPQEDEEVGVNEIPAISAISAISAERISAVEKVRIIADRLRPWRMSMGDLVLEWIIMAEGSRKALKKKRARELLSKLLEDADILDIYTEEMEKRGIAGASVALTIQGELEELREKESLFGGFDQYTDIEQLDLSQCYQAIKTHAPTLEHVITACQEGRRKYSPHKGRAVLIASTLAFGLL